VIAFVVDVNVAIVANGRCPQANKACELRCVRKLREVSENTLCIDDGDRILAEYRANLSMSGQPGVGDEFMYLVYHRQFDTAACERVAITPMPSDALDFKEIPRGSLDSLDRADRKYMAVAIASQRSPCILDAVDSDWSQHERALKAVNATVEELCSDCLCNGETA